MISWSQKYSTEQYEYMIISANYSNLHYVYFVIVSTLGLRNWRS